MPSSDDTIQAQNEVRYAAIQQVIIHDWCGWDEQYGRYTHSPSGDTLVCQAWMRQRDWDKAQLSFLQKYPDIQVRFQDGTSENTDTICARLIERL